MKRNALNPKQSIRYRVCKKNYFSEALVIFRRKTSISYDALRAGLRIFSTSERARNSYERK